MFNFQCKETQLHSRGAQSGGLGSGGFLHQWLPLAVRGAAGSPPPRRTSRPPADVTADNAARNVWQLLEHPANCLSLLLRGTGANPSCIWERAWPHPRHVASSLMIPTSTQTSHFHVHVSKLRVEVPKMEKVPLVGFQLTVQFKNH